MRPSQQPEAAPGGEGEGMDGVKQVLKAIPYGLHAIGVRSGDERNAFTANWLTQCSSDPPMLALAVENTGRSVAMMRESRVFTVNLFEAGQRREAGRLARPAARVPDKLAEFMHRDGVTGAPLLPDTLGYLECRILAEHPSGDHTLFVAVIVAGEMYRDGKALEIHAAGFTYT